MIVMRNLRKSNLIKKCWFDWKYRNIIKYKNLLWHKTMGEELITFGNVEKHKFHHYKNPSLNDVDINNILISNSISSVKKESPRWI